MRDKKFLGAASAALMIVIVATLVLAPAAAAASKYKGLHAFHVTDGANPDASLIFDAAGNLYGTTSAGGDPGCDCGVAFELSPNGGGAWYESVLHTFGSIPDGSYPYYGMTPDGMGNFFGTTATGGHHQQGTVFELTP